MLRKPPATPQEYKDMLRRRKWWIILPVAILPVLVFLVSVRIPKEYKSETLILVEPQKIPTEYVRSVITTDIEDRLQTISEEIMSRTRLLKIINDLDLYPQLRKKRTDDQIIAMMRKDITVNVIDDRNSNKHSVGAFRISYISRSPATAQEVTQKIADLFIAENLKQRDQQAQGTSAFIDNQMQQARAALDAQEQKIKAFRASHMGALPEQETSNLSLISQYQSLLQSNNDAIDRANQQRVYLQSMLNVSTGGGTAVSVVQSPLEIQLQKKQAELYAERQKYTDEYPDVIRLKGEIASLEQQIRQHPKGGGALPAVAGTGKPSEAQQLQSQLIATEQEIKARTKRQHQLEGQLSALQGRVETLPAVQSEFADLNRDYQDLQKNYQSLVEKQQSSSMAAELERHDQGEQFRILDPAQLPTMPYSPNLLLINAAGVFSALILGLLLAIIAEIRDATVHDAGDLSRYLGAPLLVAIPSLPGVQQRRRAKPRCAATGTSG